MRSTQGKKDCLQDDLKTNRPSSSKGQAGKLISRANIRIIAWLTYLLVHGAYGHLRHWLLRLVHFLCLHTMNIAIVGIVIDVVDETIMKRVKVKHLTETPRQRFF